MGDFDTWERAVRTSEFHGEFERRLLEVLNRREAQVSAVQQSLSDGSASSLSCRRSPVTYRVERAPDTLSVDEETLVPCVLLCWLIEEQIPELKAKTYWDVRALDDHLSGETDPRGKRLFEFLRSDRWQDDRSNAAADVIREVVEDTAVELTPHEDEQAEFVTRRIEQQGLPTDDAIRCLRDFEGRTLPFLRSLCAKLSPGAAVLELGAGTAVLSFCSVLAGAERAVSVELNPITCLLARRIKQWVTTDTPVAAEAVDILWGDARQFGTDEYADYATGSFDLLVVENIYTGQFFEKQVQITLHAVESELVPTVPDSGRPYRTARSVGCVVPSSMTTSVELVELEWHPEDKRTETASDAALQARVADVLTESYPYVEFDYTVDRPPAVVSTVSFDVRSPGRVDAAALFSEVNLGAGQVIERGTAEFIANDAHLMLDAPLSVQVGDTVVCGIAYVTGDHPRDVVFEVHRATDSDDRVRSHVGPERRERNRVSFAERTGIDPEFRFADLSPGIAVEHETVHEGMRRTVFTVRDDR